MRLSNKKLDKDKINIKRVKIVKCIIYKLQN